MTASSFAWIALACVVCAVIAVLVIRWFYDEIHGRPRKRRQ